MLAGLMLGPHKDKDQNYIMEFSNHKVIQKVTKQVKVVSNIRTGV